MILQKTSKTTLTSQDILDIIQNYETNYVKHLNDLWEYYKGKNVKILQRKAPDPNNPDNKIVVSYARKLVTTWTGYGYRPHYITYKANVKRDTKEISEDPTPETKVEPIEKQYLNEIQTIYNINNEHIKTNRAGRNTAIYGVSYEIAYVDGEYINADQGIELKALPRFFTVDPRQMIVLYDYSPEPKIVIGIRFYEMDNPNEYKVEVYYADRVEKYIRYRQSSDQSKWLLKSDGKSEPSPFGEVPIIPYYAGDDIQSIYDNVLSLIDAYDALFSDSMNEFDRFAFAYLIMKKFSLTSPTEKKDPFKISYALQLLKRRRVFEGLDKDADIKFLTKDIPTPFIQHIGNQLREQIHIQSHVPDFTSDKMAGASGIAIQRLMFDFENLVSSAEADFDLGLYARMRMITHFLKVIGRITVGSPEMITISHKRNVPLNIAEFAQTALTMSSAGFSRRAIVGIMPEDIIPDVEEELSEEKREQEDLMVNNFDTIPPEENISEEPEENVEEE